MQSQRPRKPSKSFYALTVLGPTPRSCFSDRSLTTSPHTRECIGLTGVFHLSAHESYTRDELIKRLHNGPGPPSFNLMCLDHSIPNYNASNPEPGPGCDIFTALNLCYKQFDPMKPLKTTSLKTLLHNFNHQICPHMHTRDKAFQRRLAYDKHTVHRMGNGGGITPNHLPIPGTRSHYIFAERDQQVTLVIQCKESNYQTKFTVYRQLNSHGSVLVHVCRQLGLLYDVMDLRWCVQLESE